MAQANEGSAYLDDSGLSSVLAKTKNEYNSKIAAQNPSVSNVQFDKNDRNVVLITWCDPLNSDWAATTIVRKLLSPPNDPSDGELVGTFTTRDSHVSVPYGDPNAVIGQKHYFYRFFCMSQNGEYSFDAPVFEVDVLTAIVGWAEGTDAQIAAMLEAHHEGTINVRDYWSVGDLHVASDGTEYRLVDSTDKYELVKDDKESNREYGAFAVVLENRKNNMQYGEITLSCGASVDFYSPSTKHRYLNGVLYTPGFAYASSEVRQYANGLIESLDNFANIFRRFKHTASKQMLTTSTVSHDSDSAVTGTYNITYAEEEIADIFAAVSGKECGNPNKVSLDHETSTIMEYYTNAANRVSIKNIGTRSCGYVNVTEQSYRIGMTCVYINSKSTVYRYEGSSTLSNDNRSILYFDNNASGGNLVAETANDTSRDYMFFGVI